MADASIRDPEHALSVVHVPLALRPGWDALRRIDDRLGGIVLEPNVPIAAIKLAWWREALERLDTAAAPPEPLLRALADHLLPAGVMGADLATIAQGWDVLIEGDGDEPAMLLLHARARGGGLFAAAATLLGGAASIDVRAAGTLWALATVPPPNRAAALALARERLRQIDRVRWPRHLRALGVLTHLARDRIVRPDARAGSPRRVARAMWHAISGR